MRLAAHRYLRSALGITLVVVGLMGVVAYARRVNPPVPEVSRRDSQLIGPAVDRFLEGPNDGARNMCALHLVEVRHVDTQIHIAAWAHCQSEQVAGVVSSAWSAPVLVKGRMNGSEFEPYSQELPGDGDLYAKDIRRLFSRGAAAELLRHRDYGLAEQLQSEALAAR